jgi:hypothetical protein
MEINNFVGRNTNSLTRLNEHLLNNSSYSKKEFKKRANGLIDAWESNDLTHPLQVTRVVGRSSLERTMSDQTSPLKKSSLALVHTLTPVMKTRLAQYKEEVMQ